MSPATMLNSPTVSSANAPNHTQPTHPVTVRAIARPLLRPPTPAPAGPLGHSVARASPASPHPSRVTGRGASRRAAADITRRA
ncbi:hypothetical protein CBZ_23670 [Cellulomonas biazotea]|uniref:Uncharacterized protein n=1 Tax=Cellulomonas biazotea TaxID=1709 RepID=A0A402DT53_9CELL|nr:hypothetical protein CBZ_23670 [Cellulomonas biazotea]